MDDAFFGPYGPPDTSLLIIKRQLLAAKRDSAGPPFVPCYWPPPAWECFDLPRDDACEAIIQWLDYVLHPVGPLRCLEVFSEKDRRGGRNGWGTRAPLNCARYVRDAWRLYQHLESLENGSSLAGHRPLDHYDPHGALVAVEQIRRDRILL